MKIRNVLLICAAALTIVSLTACGGKNEEKTTAAPTKAQSEAPLYEPYTEIETIKVAHIDQNGEMSTYYDTRVVEKTRLVSSAAKTAAPVGSTVNKGGKKQSAGAETSKQSSEKQTAKAGSTAVAAQKATVPETPQVTSIQKGSGAPSLLSVLSPVKNGSYCSLVIMGRPSTTYKLKTEGGEELAAVSDENGIASWSFPVKEGASGEMKATAYEGENSLTVSYWVY